jgi:predicted lysophospholipase L1 biosynthesis ABC-type transport system permease subunit
MFLGVARLKPGVSEARARAELAALGQRLAVEHPESNRNVSFTTLSFRDQVFGRTRQGIALPATAVAAVLLICCVNLANLLFARGVKRQRDLAVRLALGAGRGRLVRALLMESLLLSLLGGGAGIVLANGALQVIQNLAATTIPFIGEATLDGIAVGFTIALSLITAFVFGLLPALRRSRPRRITANPLQGREAPESMNHPGSPSNQRGGIVIHWSACVFRLEFMWAANSR